MNATIKVLDHGYVRLVDAMASDLAIVRSARVSHDAEWRAGADAGADAKLIRYLWRHRHTTPFEACVFTFEVMAPLFVFRQWHRHRTWTYNEVSARYTELPELFYVPRPEHIGVQSASSKQAREIMEMTDVERRAREDEIDHYFRECSRAFENYKERIAWGWPRELARMGLPVSTYSRMFATVDLHNLLHFLTLRTHEHAQYEIRVYAEAIRELIAPIVPVALESWANTVVTVQDREALEAQHGGSL